MQQSFQNVTFNETAMSKTISKKAMKTLKMKSTLDTPAHQEAIKTWKK